MKITFKNVGQGDTIIIEWYKNKQKFIGIIDCKKVSNFNPVIDYISKHVNFKIKFIALSHPHFDHYSGLLELLEYVSEKGIIIEYFINSANKHTKYLKWAEIDSEKSKLLAQIFHKSIELYENNQITNIEYPYANWQIELNNEYSIKSLSPSDEETRAFVKFVNYFKDSHEYKCSQAANLLSTVFEISNSNSYFLLTSDAQKDTFQRFYKRSLNNFTLNLLLTQIPHHGSEDNHFKPFWNKIRTNESCPAIISAGEHKKYNHPHYQVIKDFYNIGYHIFSTNNINGVRDFMRYEKTSSLSLKLDNDSGLIEEFQVEGDHIFEINKDIIKYCL